jgi:hypothetical protein
VWERGPELHVNVIPVAKVKAVGQRGFWVDRQWRDLWFCLWQCNAMKVHQNNVHLHVHQHLEHRRR